MSVDRDFPTSLTDLAQLVMQQIAHRTGGGICDLKVNAESGRLEIRGWTESYYFKQLSIQLAEDAVRSWAGTPSLQLDVKITVKPPEPHQGPYCANPY